VLSPIKASAKALEKALRLLDDQVSFSVGFFGVVAGEIAPVIFTDTLAAALNGAIEGRHELMRRLGTQSRRRSA
jgi:hypothetical protein